MTWLTAIQKAPSWPWWIGTHSSATLAVMQRSGEKTTTLAPRWRASTRKCASGVRVISTLEPTVAMKREWYQSALSATSVCSPHTSGEAGGRSQYQS